MYPSLCVLILCVHGDVVTLKPEAVAGPGKTAGGQVAILLGPIPSEWSGARSWEARDRHGSFSWKGSPHHVFLDHAGAEGENPARLWHDLDGDGVLGTSEGSNLAWRSVGNLHLAEVPLSLEGLAFEFVAYRSDQGLGLSLRGSFHLEASFERGGEDWRALFVDGDLDGRIGHERDVWIAGPTRFIESIGLQNAITDLPSTRERWFVDPENWVRIGSSEEDGNVTLVFEPAETSHDRQLSDRAREVDARFFAWFEADRGAFFEENGIDPSRPRVERPAD